jgi:lysophospholipase L1-like esterase
VKVISEKLANNPPDDRPRRQKRRSLIFALIALGVSLSASAFMLEIFLRILGHHGAPESAIGMVYRVDDPMLNWRRMPNVEIREGRISYRFNNSGFRDVDHTVEKPRGVTRIIVVGDSVTEGYGVEWKSAFSSVIQSRLGPQFEVIVIAAPGLNTPQEVHLFEQEGLRYKPDVVIVNFVLNDCDFYSNLEGAQRYEAETDSRIGLLNVRVDPRIKRFLKSSALIYFFKERVENLKARIMGGESVDYFTGIWSKEENRRKVTNGFDRLAALQSEKEFEIVVMVWPVLTKYGNYPFGAIHEWVYSQAKARGLSSIDLLAEFSKIPYRELQVSAEDNIHPNALGHTVAGESFVSWYRRRSAGGFSQEGDVLYSGKDHGISRY